MAWKIINEAKVVKCDETGRVGIQTGTGEVKVIGSGEGGDPEQIETLVEEKVEEQIQTQLDSTIQDKVDKAVSDALGGSGDSSEVEAEIDSWF